MLTHIKISYNNINRRFIGQLGATDGDNRVFGSWNNAQAKKHLNILELLAVRLGLLGLYNEARDIVTLCVSSLIIIIRNKKLEIIIIFLNLGNLLFFVYVRCRKEEEVEVRC